MKWLTYLFTAGLGGMALAKVIRRTLLRYLIKTAYLPAHSKLYYSTLKLIEGSSPKLFDFQDSLPSLPVPDLAQTCKAYLESVKPLVSPEQFKITEEVVKEFLEKEGPELQKLLLQRASQQRNWLSDWWLEYAYLRFRGPLPVNISFYGYEPMYSPSKFTDPCKKAAYLARRSLEFKKRVDTQSLEPMRVGGVVPVDMDGYRYIYGTTRIAAKDKDIMRTYVPGKNAHILLCIGSALFTLPVVVDGKYASEEQLEEGIRGALKEAEDIGRWSTPNLSIMTSENRDTWANTRAHLLDISETNRTSMEAIEQALFAIVLHEDAHTKPGQDPEDAMNEVNRVLFVGDGRHYWFDKCFSFIVFSNGRSGFNVEHTWADAPIILHHMEYIYNSPDNGGPKGFGTAIKATKLQWEVDEAVNQAIKVATLNFDILSKGVALRAVLFKGFGKELAKKSKISPDALCQAALQVAGIKYFGHPVLTYESAATRTFYKGRTETIRSATKDMVNFANSFIKSENNIQDDETKKLLRDALSNAAKTHSKISRICSAGQGIDRHLLGLKLTALTNGLPMPKIFTDDSYKLEYRLSTSQTPLSQEYFKTKYQDLNMGGGFGPTSADGIGCSYHVLSNVLYFNLSATGSDPSGNVAKFAAALESTLESLQRLLN